MRITFLVEKYYPDTGGVPSVTRYLAEGLAALGHKVKVFTRLTGTGPKQERLNGVEIIRFDLRSNSFHLFPSNSLKYREAVQKENSDAYIFECCQSVTTDVLLPCLSKIKGKKILHSHGFSGLTLKPFRRMGTLWHTVGNTYNYLYWNYYFKHTLPKYMNDFDTALCLSSIDSSKNYIERHFKGRLHILGNAADDIFFETPDDAEDILGKYTRIKGKGYFVSVANYLSLKNQLGIIEEYRKSGRTDYDLVLIGSKESPYYHRVLEKAEKINGDGAGAVHVLLGVERKDIPAILHKASLYLVGSTVEAFSISLIEAMAQGVPFVSTRVGNAELLPGGIVVDDIGQMHEKIREISEDFGLAEKLSAEGRAYAYRNCRIEKAVAFLNDIVCGKEA